MFAGARFTDHEGTRYVYSGVKCPVTVSKCNCKTKEGFYLMSCYCMAF